MHQMAGTPGRVNAWGLACSQATPDWEDQGGGHWPNIPGGSKSLQDIYPVNFPTGNL